MMFLLAFSVAVDVDCGLGRGFGDNLREGLILLGELATIVGPDLGLGFVSADGWLAGKRH